MPPTVSSTVAWRSSYPYASPTTTTRSISHAPPYALLPKKTVIRTPVAERIGTVKEVFNIGDYKFDIKGVLIAETAKGYPDDEVYRLRMLFESAAPVRLINAVSDLFMDNSRNVCITDIDFPDAPAQELRCRPFSLSCESDSVTNLLVQ